MIPYYSFTNTNWAFYIKNLYFKYFKWENYYVLKIFYLYIYYPERSWSKY